MSLKLIVEDLKEISTLLAVSHQSKGGTVLLKRHDKTILNPSAYSTVNAWHPKHKIVQTSLLDMIKTGDGGKLSTFILTSILISLNKLEDQQRIKQTHILKNYLNDIINQIKKQSLPIDNQALLNLGKEDHELAQKIIECFEIGEHISLEKGDKVGVDVEITESIKTDVVTLNLESDRRLKGTMLALFNERLTDPKQVEECMSLMGTFPHRPLLVVAPMISRKVRSMIKLNDNKGIIECECIECPRITWAKGWLDDLASFTGATVFDSFLHKEFKIEYYGSAMEIYISLNQITVDPYDDHIDTTLDRVNMLLKEAESIPHPYTQDLWRKRASSLNGSLIKVKIGSYTDTESRVRRNRAEKILMSMTDAQKNGYIKNPIKNLFLINTQNPILDRALKAPVRVIQKNKDNYDLKILDELDDCFPTGRLISLIENIISVSTTLGLVDKIL